MSIENQYYVYHDENYALSWISENISKRISEYLAKKGFKEINTDNLVKIMDEGIRNTSIDITIVFSHDVIPDKLLDDISSPTRNSLFRKFLDAGHTIIWLGDAPAWYVGFPKKEKKPLPQPSSIQNLTGVNQPPKIINGRIVVVKPTLEGLLLGIKPWKGKRPHEYSTEPNYEMLPLAISREGAHGYIVSHKSMHSTLSGFIRLYDFNISNPNDLTDDMLECILNIALKKTIWEELSSLIRKFDLLRSEVDEKLVKKLDLILEKLETTKEKK
jgi:hypothetical protein